MMARQAKVFVMKVKVTHVANKQSNKATKQQDANDYLQAIKDKIAVDRQLKRVNAEHPLDDDQAIIFDGEVKSVLVRKPNRKERCIIDWLNFVLDAEEFYALDEQCCDWTNKQQQDYAVKQVSNKLLEIIGFGVDVESPSGRNFYERTFLLENNTGYISIGGQGGTILVSINGNGCTYGNTQWEFSMYGWLSSLVKSTITRVDIAHDVFDNPMLSVDYFDKVHSEGGFNTGGRNPNIEYRGNWKYPNDRGRTLYIGSRLSDKFCRIYEKGKQLGDSQSNWLRIEVEFKAKDIYIPHDVLISPTSYMIACHPCFEVIEQNKFITRFEKCEKNELLTFDQAISILKKQYGRYLHFFRQCYQDDTALLDELTNIGNKSVPDRLDILTIPKHFQIHQA